MADEKIITSSVFEQGITEIMQDIANNLYEFEEYTEEEVANLIDLSEEEVAELTRVINDTTVALNKVYSNKKVEDLLTELEVACNQYADEKIGGLAGIHLAYVDTLPATGEDNVIYILKSTTGGNDTFNLYNNGWISIGEFSISLDNYYDKAEVDALLNDKANANEVVSQNDVVSDMSNVSSSTVLSTAGLDVELEKKIDKDNIVTVLDDSVTDKQVASAKAVVDELDKKANDDEVVKKTDITTTINSSSVDTQVPSAKTIYDEFIVDKIKDYYVNINSSTALSKYGIDDITTLTSLLSLTSKLETNIRFTMQINDAFKQTLYDCGVIPVNVGGLLVISQQSRGKAIYTTDFCETYVNVTSNVKSTEWGKWQKVRTTTVGDVRVTTITPVNSVITGTMEYTVKNGICYVSLSNVISTTTNNNLSISTTMPKPAINSSSAIYKQLGGVNIGMVYIKKNTTQLTANIYTADKMGDCNFSYPVAE